MREAIRLALVNKYKSLGYSQKAINAVLDYLEKSVKEETEIEEAVNGVGPILKSFQSEIDARVTAAEKLRKEKEEEESADKGKSDGVDSETGKKSTKKEEDGMPAWAKTFTEGLQTQVATLQSELTNIKSGETSKSRKQIIEQDWKDAPEKIKATFLKDFERMSFGKEEDFEAYREEKKADLAEITQSLTDQGLGQSSRPFTPAGAGASKAGIEADIAAWGKANAPVESAK